MPDDGAPFPALVLRARSVLATHGITLNSDGRGRSPNTPASAGGHGMKELTQDVRECLNNTIGIMLTAFDGEFSRFSLHRLSQTVDISLFKQFYILANCPTKEHVAMLKKYDDEFDNLQVAQYSPKGLPMVTQMLNHILEKHRDDIIYKMDDDLFLTPGCVYGLVETYLTNRDDPTTALVSPLVLNNTASRNLMKEYLQQRYPDETPESMFEGGVSSNEPFVRFTWEKELSDNILTGFRDAQAERMQSTRSYLNINCVMMDSRVLEKVLPFQEFDEHEINSVRFSHQMHHVIDTQNIAYHYAFGPFQEFMRDNYPLDVVLRHVLAVR